MLRKSNLLFLLVISSLIIQTFSAVLWELEEEANEVEAVRKNRKQRNFNRGVLLSYTTELKNKLCRDLYHAQLYAAEADSSSEDESRRPVSDEETAVNVDKIAAGEKVHEDLSQKGAEEANKKVTSYTSGAIKASEEVTGRTAGTAEKDEPSVEDPEEEDESEIKVTDEPTNEGLPQHALVVKKVTTETKALAEEDIFFTCAILNTKDVKPRDDLYLFSTAFLSDWFYISTLAAEHHDQATLSHDHGKLSQDQASLSHYLARSPRLELLRQDELENRYAAIRDTLETIKGESPNYVELIVKKNDLASLNTFKRKLLCASILSSPIYQVERLEAMKSFDSDDDEENKLFGETELHVAFKNLTYDHKGFKANCIPCYGYEDYYEDPADAVEMCLTPSFNDRNSLYVLKEEIRDDKRWILSKYFETVSILTHAREPVTQTDLFEL